jgi:hypothetical protein
MRNPAVPPYVPLAFLFLIFGFWAFWSWQRRGALRYFFDAQKTDESELQQVSEHLETLSEHCSSNSFYAERLAHTALQGHDILLVYGRVFAHGPRGSSSNMSIYALGSGEDAEWMRRFSDVFELAFTYSDLSVFWVRLGTLMRLTRRCSELRDSSLCVL